MSQREASAYACTEHESCSRVFVSPAPSDLAGDWHFTWVKEPPGWMVTGPSGQRFKRLVGEGDSPVAALPNIVTGLVLAPISQDIGRFAGVFA